MFVFLMLQESVELPLTHPEYYEEMGIKPPKGVILYGPPGTSILQFSNTCAEITKCKIIYTWLVFKALPSLSQISYNCFVKALFSFSFSFPSLQTNYNISFQLKIGKTLLAKAVANQTSATFLRVVGSELIQKYLGDGPKLVRELFRVAEEHAPSIVFIDEIDAIGTKRCSSELHFTHRDCQGQPKLY